MTLKLKSNDLTEDRIERLEGENKFADRLFPEVPTFTVCVAIAYFGTDDEDPEGEYPVLETTNLLIKAPSASSAMEKAVIATVNTLEDDDVERYTMSIVGVFEGDLPDLSNDYLPTAEALAAAGEDEGVDVET